MKKFNVLLLSFSLLGFSFYGLFADPYYVQLLIDTSAPFIYARTALVAAFLAYVFVPSLRLYTARTLVGVGGVLMVVLGIISLGSPSLVGYTDAYILLGDSLTLIEAGILAIVLSSELSAQRSQYIVNTFGYLRTLVTSSPKKVTYIQLANSVYGDTGLARRLQKHNLAVPISKQLINGYVVPKKAPA